MKETSLRPKRRFSISSSEQLKNSTNAGEIFVWNNVKLSEILEIHFYVHITMKTYEEDAELSYKYVSKEWMFSSS
jgi:hypothetical protein